MVKILTDINSDYKEQLNSSELVTGTDALNNMLLNLFTTSSQLGSFLGDRIFEPTFGCDLERYLFEQVDDTTAQDIKNTIYDSVSNFLPEIYMPRSAIFVITDYDNDAYDVTLMYSYQGDPRELRFTLKRRISAQ